MNKYNLTGRYLEELSRTKRETIFALLPLWLTYLVINIYFPSFEMLWFSTILLFGVIVLLLSYELGVEDKLNENQKRTQEAAY